MKIKVTFFNPETLRKSVTRFIFAWDYNNHCWDITTITNYGEHKSTYSGEPMCLVNRYINCRRRSNEYATVKFA